MELSNEGCVPNKKLMIRILMIRNISFFINREWMSSVRTCLYAYKVSFSTHMGINIINIPTFVDSIWYNKTKNILVYSTLYICVRRNI